MNPSMRTGFFTELEEQPDVWLRCLEGAQAGLRALEPLRERLRQGKLKRVVFSGMGGSFAALVSRTWHVVWRIRPSGD